MHYPCLVKPHRDAEDVACEQRVALEESLREDLPCEPQETSRWLCRRSVNGVASGEVVAGQGGGRAHRTTGPR